MFSIPIVAVVLGYIWIVEPVAPRWARPAPVVIVLGLAMWRVLKNREWGFRRSAFLPALGWAAAFTTAGAVVIYLAGSRLDALGEGRNGADLWRRLIILIPWAVGQQFALQAVVLRESQEAASRRGGIVLAAALFGILHLPNLFLASVTSIAALAWCWIYDRHPNLIPLALSHALLTLAILYALNAAVSLQIGAAYLRSTP